MPATWDENAAAYEKMKDYLEDKHFLHWAVFYDGKLAGVYRDGLEARRESWVRFGGEPFYIRVVGNENLEKKRQHLAAAMERRGRHDKD